MIRFDLATMTPDLAVAALRGAKRALKAEEMPNQSVLQIYPGYFNVHSQSGGGSYVVVNSAPDCSGKWSCSCPDFQYRQGPAELDCKHIIKTKRTLDTVVKARMNIDDWEEPQSQHLIHRVDDLIEQGKTATREDCTFNAETCQGCMLFSNCRGHAERVETSQ
jgi:hypothetical protein